MSGQPALGRGGRTVFSLIRVRRLVHLRIDEGTGVLELVFRNLDADAAGLGRGDCQGEAGQFAVDESLEAGGL